MKRVLLLAATALFACFNGSAQYCIPNPTTGTTDGDFIDGVVLGTINNTGSGGTTGANYNDYSLQSTNLDPNAAYSLAITGGDYAPDYYAAWIDYDQSGTFDASEKLGEFVTAAAAETQNIAFTVPGGALVGTTIMRVRCAYGAVGMDPCTDYVYGETEDYAIVINDIYCTPNPTSGTTAGDFIDGVFLGSISNLASGSTTGPNYTNYTATMSTSIAQSSNNSIEITGGTYAPNNYAAWIDYDQSGVFDASEKLGEFVTSASGEMQAIAFTVPAGATLGTTRLRVRAVYAVTGMDACTDYTYGETEDYGIVITTGTGTPAPVADFSGTPLSIGVGGTVNFTDLSTNTPTSWFWSFTNGTPATSTAQNPTNISWTQVGCHDVTLMVSNAGGTDTKTSTCYVTVVSGNPMIVSSSSTDANCSASDGSATVSVTGGSGSFTYSWSPTGGTGATASNLAAGTYVCTINDGSNTTTETVVVNASSGTMTATATATDEDCGSQNGTATATAANGTAPYGYFWSTGDMSATASNLSVGTYDCMITDANGCMTQVSATVGSSSGLSAGVNSTNDPCGAGAGTASATPTGGTAPYTYDWSTGETAQSIVNLFAGTYTCIITDNNGCSDMVTFTITGGSANIIANETSTAEDCGQANGSASVAPSGGTAPYSYNWSSGGNSASVSNIGAGTYTCDITDANGCSTTVSVLVPSSSGMATSVNSTNVSCPGGLDGSISIIASGGSGSFTYLWQGGSTSSSLSNLAAGSYICQVDDGNGCVIMETVVITAPTGATISFTTTQDICGQENGTATVNTSGGTPPYTATWANGDNGATATDLAAGSISVNLVDANGCFLSETTTIGAYTVLMQGTTSSTQEDCGASNGTANVSVTGGTAPYSYNWSNGASGTDVTNLASGTYFVTMTDLDGCSEIEQVNVANSGGLGGIVSSTDVICAGDATGEATVMAAGGTAPYTFNWSSGGSSDTESNLAAGNYTCYISDANGCSYTASIAVSDPEDFTFYANVINESGAGNADGSAEIMDADGMNGVFSYLWPDGQTGEIATGLGAGAYSVEVTDITGCISYITVNVWLGLDVANFASAAFDLSAYPNPSNGLVFVKFNMPTNEKVNLAVVNGLGQIVYSNQAKLTSGSHQMEVDLTGQASGVYFLKAFGSEHSVTKRIILE